MGCNIKTNSIWMQASNLQYENLTESKKRQEQKILLGLLTVDFKQTFITPG